ncbi:MAG TPA: 2-oxo-4-hydroxy-4-carboxy-5-ureidoimidazoline decarboxylase [Thermoanaerobaculia bacterium]|jgi:OHCU decarboxylase
MTGVERLNGLGAEEAQAELLACCGSTAWARRMAEERPFRDLDHLRETAERVWGELTREDWLEAFRAHPRIGDPKATGRAAREQVATRSAPPEVLAALAAGNRRYESRFGHVFLICATGKSAAEMVEELEKRLSNDRALELRIAAAEQRKITRLRLGGAFGQ